MYKFTYKFDRHLQITFLMYLLHSYVISLIIIPLNEKRVNLELEFQSKYSILTLANLQICKAPGTQMSKIANLEMVIKKNTKLRIYIYKFTNLHLQDAISDSNFQFKFCHILSLRYLFTLDAASSVEVLS